jgi:hypothetical protein
MNFSSCSKSTFQIPWLCSMGKIDCTHLKPYMKGMQP